MVKTEDIKKAIEVLKICKMSWADQIPNDDELISDYDAIEQSIKCLTEYMEESYH